MKNFLEENDNIFIPAKYSILIGWGLLLSVMFPSLGIAILTIVTLAYLYQAYYPKKVS